MSSITSSRVLPHFGHTKISQDGQSILVQGTRKTPPKAEPPEMTIKVYDRPLELEMSDDKEAMVRKQRKQTATQTHSLATSTKDMPYALRITVGKYDRDQQATPVEFAEMGNREPLHVTLPFRAQPGQNVKQHLAEVGEVARSFLSQFKVEPKDLEALNVWRKTVFADVLTEQANLPPAEVNSVKALDTFNRHSQDAAGTLQTNGFKAKH